MNLSLRCVFLSFSILSLTQVLGEPSMKLTEKGLKSIPSRKGVEELYIYKDRSKSYGRKFSGKIKSFAQDLGHTIGSKSLLQDDGLLKINEVIPLEAWSILEKAHEFLIPEDENPEDLKYRQTYHIIGPEELKYWKQYHRITPEELKSRQGQYFRLTPEEVEHWQKGNILTPEEQKYWQEYHRLTPEEANFIELTKYVHHYTEDVNTHLTWRKWMLMHNVGVVKSFELAIKILNEKTTPGEPTKDLWIISILSILCNYVAPHSATLQAHLVANPLLDRESLFVKGTKGKPVHSSHSSTQPQTHNTMSEFCVNGICLTSLWVIHMQCFWQLDKEDQLC